MTPKPQEKEPAAETDALVVAIARAFHWQEQIESGSVASISALTDQEGVGEAFVLLGWTPFVRLLGAKLRIFWPNFPGRPHPLAAARHPILSRPSKDTMASSYIHKRIKELCRGSPISAVDLFCGAGGLTHGLMSAGIPVEAGIDIDENARFAYEANNPGAKFLAWNVCSKKSPSIRKLFASKKLTLLAGCAPCTPFSKLTNGMDNHSAYRLLDNFGRYVAGLEPDLVTMENVPELAERGWPVFQRFLDTLRKAGFHEPAWDVVYCPDYGVPQSRRRLVLLASRLGPIELPEVRPGYRYPSQQRTVRKVIGKLRPLESGEVDPKDSLHAATQLSALNLRRIRATPKDGGSRSTWRSDLVLDCHKRDSGKTYGSIYGRMWWDRPAPTMTTLCTGIGNGRFGHPDQDRSITLREAALFQTFPRSYKFWPADQRMNRSAISRMIGNAVPPRLARALGEQLIRHAAEHGYHRSERGLHRAAAV